ncbi:protein kinase [bacterium]|nr:protein kinase [bacterium]
MHFNPGDSFAQGKYRLEEVIGDGSDAQVWLAYEHRVQRDVVIKILREPNVDVGARHRFEVEARALGAINHDGVIKLLEYSSEPGSPSYMVLDHGGTKTLLSCIKGECEVFNNMGPRERLAKFNVVVEGLAAAHTGVHNQIIHRDIKPNNILWDGSRFRLCDFGRCSIDGISGGDVSGQFIGNFVNPAPEQFFENPIVTAETDVFNIVAAMHSMLTGDGIYRVEGLFDTKDAAVAGRIVWGEAFKKTDKPLRAIIEAGLKYSPNERYPEAASLHSDIARYLNNEKVSVSIETPQQKVHRWVKRYPWPAALLSSLIMVAGLMTYIAYQERVGSQQTQHILHAFSGLLHTLDPLQPVANRLSQSASLKELQDTLGTSNNLSDALRGELYYSLGADYMQLNAFSSAADAFSVSLNFVDNDLAKINLAWCTREKAHRIADRLVAQGMYQEALALVSPIMQRIPTGDAKQDYIILFAKNRYASILLALPDAESHRTALKMLKEIDGELRNRTDIERWLLPVNTGNIASAHARFEEFLESINYHEQSEQDFKAAGLSLHPEMTFAYSGQGQAHMLLGNHTEGMRLNRLALQHRRELGGGYTDYYLAGLLNLYTDLLEHFSGSAQPELKAIEKELCERMHDPRLENDIRENVHEFHNAHCQNNK